MTRVFGTIGLIFALAACTRSNDMSETPADRGEIAAAARAFLGHAHSFDYEAMQANATADFEILIFGQRLDMDGFIALLTRMAESRDGRPLAEYELEDLNTEIAGDVAYTSWASPNWLESAVFVRANGRWLIDRAASVPVQPTP